MPNNLYAFEFNIKAILCAHLNKATNVNHIYVGPTCRPTVQIAGGVGVGGGGGWLSSRKTFFSMWRAFFSLWRQWRIEGNWRPGAKLNFAHPPQKNS